MSREQTHEGDDLAQYLTFQSAGEAYAILKEIPLYEKSGILCRIPNWWKNRQAGLRVAVNMGNDAPSSLGMDALLDFSARLILGESVISEEEVRKLLEEAEGLARAMRET